VPVVALTYRYEKKAPPYRLAVGAAGVQCVDITPVSPRSSMEGLAGLVLSGGTDIGEDRERDELESTLLDDALRRQLPVLAICRGQQLLNCHLGGTLYLDIPGHRPVAGEVIRHDVTIEGSSKLAEIVGGPACVVNSRHHQAIDRVAKALRVTAIAPDGIIEAVEDPTRPFVVGVQWHPEDLIDEPAHRALFDAFAKALH